MSEKNKGPAVRYVVIHSPGPAWKSGVDFRQQPGARDHVAHYSQLYKEGRLAQGGPYLDSSGGMMVGVPGETKEALEEFAAADPAVKSGLIEFQVKPWLVAMEKTH